MKVEITQPIYSGILGGDRVFPVVATQGLRIQMTLDNKNRSLENPTDLGIKLGLNDVETKVAMLGATGATALLKQEKQTPSDTFEVIIKRPVDSANGRGVNRNAEPSNNNPFDIGDMLYVALADRSAEAQLGVISSMTRDGDNDLKLVFCPNRANNDALGLNSGGTGTATDYPVDSRIYIKQEDRTNGITVTQVFQLVILFKTWKCSYCKFNRHHNISKV